MMKVLIIEDELPSARRLERLLQNFEMEILGKLSSISASVSWLQKNPPPDVIFLDVQLSDGLCFEIFKEVTISSKIIFTTAFGNYSIKAFDYNSISYLLKPIKKESLEKAINKVTEVHQKEVDLEILKKVLMNYNIKNYKTSFTNKVGNKIKIIGVDDIHCFYSFENATYLHTDRGNFIINNSLTNLESNLNPEQFFRVNRTFIVHINAIKDIVAYSNSRLKLILNSFKETEIIVSRDRVKDFKNWID